MSTIDRSVPAEDIPSDWEGGNLSLLFRCEAVTAMALGLFGCALVVEAVMFFNTERQKILIGWGIGVGVYLFPVLGTWFTISRTRLDKRLDESEAVRVEVPRSGSPWPLTDGQLLAIAPLAMLLVATPFAPVLRGGVEWVQLVGAIAGVALGSAVFEALVALRIRATQVRRGVEFLVPTRLQRKAVVVFSQPEPFGGGSDEPWTC